MTKDALHALLYSSIRDWNTLQRVASTVHNEGLYTPPVLPRDDVESTEAELIAHARNEVGNVASRNVSDQELFVFVRTQLRRHHHGADNETVTALGKLFGVYQPNIVWELLGRMRDYLCDDYERTEEYIQLRFERDEHDRIRDVRIAYYENIDKAVRDIRAVTTPERWAARVRNRSAEEARDFGATLKGFFVETSDRLFFARTVEEIQHVYAEGPSSCMDGGHTFHAIRDANIEIDGTRVVSPVACYASPDMAVAYLKRSERITARAVTNEKDKTWARCYGDVESLIRALETAGYRHNMHALDGCRLRHIEDDEGRRLQPFVDYAGAGFGRKDPYGNNASTSWGQMAVSELTVRDDDGEWRIISAATGLLSVYETGFAGGYEPTGGWTCDNCGDDYEENDNRYFAMNHHGHENSICESCRDNDYIECRDDGYDYIYVHYDAAVRVDGEYYMRRSAPEHAECEHCNDNYTHDNLTEVITDGQEETSEMWCSHCIRRAQRQDQIVDAETTDGDSTYTIVEETHHWDGRHVTLAEYERLTQEDPADENAA